MHKLYKPIAAAAVVSVLFIGLGALSKDGRAYVAGRFALLLDRDTTASLLKSVDGGAIKGEVVTLVADPVNKKALAQLQYEIFEMQLGMTMGKPLYDWIKASFDLKPVRKNGSIVAADFNYKEMSRRDFTQALITEFSVPKLDGASKEPAYLTVKFSPESIVLVKGSGQKVDVTDTKKKQFLPSNFRLKIDGLDCTRVNKIEALTVKQTTIDQKGIKIPGKLEYPNLKVTLSQTGSESWYDWFESFAIKGNNGDEQEKKGSLEFLASDLKSTLLTLNFSNLGIYCLLPDTAEANSDNVSRLTAELYCERITIDAPAAAAP